MTEVAGIVLNEETVANRDKAYWNGSEYQVVDEHYWPLEEGTVYSVEEHLPDWILLPRTCATRKTNRAFTTTVFPYLE